MSQQQPPKSKSASIVRYKMELRKAIRKAGGPGEVNFLNITAMLDMMTIILVFLLKSTSSSTAAIPQSDDMKLPSSIMTGEPAQDGTVVLISKTQILVGDDPNPVVKLPSRDSLAQSGVDARFKRNGPNDTFIVPLANALQHAREQEKQLRAAKGGNPNDGSEAIIVADGTTPYRLLVEVMSTLGSSEYTKYHLMVLSGAKK